MSKDSIKPTSTMSYEDYCASVPYSTKHIGKPTKHKTHYELSFDTYHYFRYLAFIRNVSENLLANEVFDKYISEMKLR